MPRHDLVKDKKQLETDKESLINVMSQIRAKTKLDDEDHQNLCKCHALINTDIGADFWTKKRYF